MAAATLKPAGTNRTREKKQRRAQRSEDEQARAGARMDQDLAAVRRILIGAYGVDNSGIVCSEPWADVAVDAVRRGIVALSKKVGKLSINLYLKGVYPPDGRETLMRTCPECGRHCPPSVRDPVDVSDPADAALCAPRPGGLEERTNGRCVDCLCNLAAPRDYMPVIYRRAGKYTEVVIAAGFRSARLEPVRGTRGEFKVVCASRGAEGEWEDDELIEDPPIADPPSYTAVAMRALADRREVLRESTLPTERTADLKRLIASQSAAP